MTVRLYTRVSSAGQVEKYSLAFQQDKGEQWARFQTLKPIRLYEERGISGTRNDRPELAALLDDLRPDDTVVVYSLSRLGRGGVVQLLGIVGQIREKGARLVSLTESVDTETTTGRLMLTLLAALAEMEIEVTRERTMGGRLQAASQGIYPHNTDSLPFGYIRGEDGRIAEGPRADDLRLVFDLAKGGASYLGVATELNRRGVPTAGRGSSWSANTVMKMIGVSTYMTGVLQYRQSALPDEPAAWVAIPAPPLVTAEAWESAQRPRTMNHPHRRPELYPLTGHLECGCGTPLVGSTNRPGPGKPGKAYRYYSCRERIRGTPVCPSSGLQNKAYPADEVEARARDALVATLQTPAALSALAALSDPPPDPHAEERDRLSERRAALVDLHLDGLIDRAEFKRRRDDLDARIQAMLPPPLPVPDLPDMGAYAEAAHALTDEAYRELLALLRVRWRVVGSGVDVVSLSVPR